MAVHGLRDLHHIVPFAGKLVDFLVVQQKMRRESVRLVLRGVLHVKQDELVTTRVPQKHVQGWERPKKK